MKRKLGDTGGERIKERERENKKEKERDEVITRSEFDLDDNLGWSELEREKKGK